MTRLQFILGILEDIAYSAECWLQSKSEAFNAFFGSMICCFLWMMFFVALMFPQLGIL